MLLKTTSPLHGTASVQVKILINTISNNYYIENNSYLRSAEIHVQFNPCKITSLIRATSDSICNRLNLTAAAEMML